MSDIANGRHEVFEVKVGMLSPGGATLKDDFGVSQICWESVGVATFWRRKEAGAFMEALLDRTLRGPELDTHHVTLGNSGEFRRPVIVADGMAYYETGAEPIPIDFIYHDAAQAAADYIKSHPDEPVRPEFVELAGHAPTTA